MHGISALLQGPRELPNPLHNVSLQQKDSCL